MFEIEDGERKEEEVKRYLQSVGEVRCGGFQSSGRSDFVTKLVAPPVSGVEGCATLEGWTEEKEERKHDPTPLR